MKGEIDSRAVIVGDCSTAFQVVARTPPERIDKEIESLNNTLNQLDLIYRTLCPTVEEYTFFSSISLLKGRATDWMIEL